MRRSRSRTATIGCRRNGTGKTFVSPLTATAASIMANFKAVRSHGRRQRSFCLLADMGAELALHDGSEKSAHFVFLATDLEFNPAIGQVAHPAGELEALVDVPKRPTKADALHIALVKNLDRHHRQIVAKKIDGFNTDRKMAHP